MLLMKHICNKKPRKRRLDHVRLHHLVTDQYSKNLDFVQLRAVVVRQKREKQPNVGKAAVADKKLFYSFFDGLPEGISRCDFPLQHQLDLLWLCCCRRGN